MATLVTGNQLTLSQQSAESGVLDWTAGANATLVIDTAHAYDDTHAFKITATAAGPAQITTGTGTKRVTGLTPGNTYEISARLYGALARQMKLTINWRNGTGPSGDPQYAQLMGPKGTAGAFTRVVDYVTVPAGANGAEVILAPQSLAAAESVWVDQVVVRPAPVLPVVDAGPDQTVSPGASVSASGSAVDPDGGSVTLLWTIDGSYTGPAVTLSGATTATVSFTAPTVIDGVAIPLTLTATDGQGDTASSSVTITVAPNNTGLLDGNLLSIGQQSLEGETLKWQAGTNATVALSTSNPYDGTHSLRLTAVATAGTAVATTGTGLNAIQSGFIDSRGYQAACRAHLVAAANRNIRCIVNYRDVNNVSLGGQSSVVLGAAVAGADTYLADSGFNPPIGTRKAEVIFQISSPVAGEYVELDQLYFGSPNQAPVVNVGNDITVDAGSTVNLTGTAVDPDLNSMTYLWTVDPSYTGPTITLVGATTLTPHFTAPASINGAVVPLILRATDSNGLVGSDNLAVTVRPGPFVYRREAGAWVRRKLRRRVAGDWVWP